jgi:hypothetical protein
MELAPVPFNENERVKTVIKTGLIDSPNSEMFLVYCDLAKDLTGFQSATFSLFDGNNQCSISSSGRDEFVSGSISDKGVNNICAYVLLDTEPLLMPDLRKDPIWKNHPKILDGTTTTLGYAGFPVINRDNYALGTLCMKHPKPRELSQKQIELVKKITSNMAHLLDLHIEQKELTSNKVLEIINIFKQKFPGFTISDLEAFLSLAANLDILEINASNLLKYNLCEKNTNSSFVLSHFGRKLLEDMELRVISDIFNIKIKNMTINSVRSI